MTAAKLRAYTGRQGVVATSPVRFEAADGTPMALARVVVTAVPGDPDFKPLGKAELVFVFAPAAASLPAPEILEACRE